MLLRLLVLLALTPAVPAADASPAGVPPSVPILDDQGRQLFPGGFVALEDIPYTAEDYGRMVRMGANFQVIRMPAGMIGAWPGCEPDEKALAHFDRLVRLGKAAGMHTVFKLVFYGIRPAGEQGWEMIWKDADGSHDRILEGWRRIWTRYRDEPSVFGYDLINEPARGRSKDYERTQREALLPLLRRLTDELQRTSPGKWVLYQPLLRKPEDQTTKHRDPVVPIEEPLGRERIIYAPHLYQMDPSLIGPMLDSLQRQAARSAAPLMLGEWGPPTRATTEDNPREQARFAKVYQFTANQMDARGIGGIKPWFCGARKPVPAKGSGNWMTWALFSDDSPAGRVERKYLADAIARPRPLVVAGRVQRYGFDFGTRTFEMLVEVDPGLGSTEIFVPAGRHYPRGYRLEIGTGLALDRETGSGRLRTVRADGDRDRKQADLVHWDEDRQRLTVGHWQGPPRTLTLRIHPTTPG